MRRCTISCDSASEVYNKLSIFDVIKVLEERLGKSGIEEKETRSK